jgi:CheY-like chemotaxis protein
MTGALLIGKRVMVAEDELLVAMLIEDVLADAGCLLVGPFSNVSDALAAARDAMIDIALLDVNLRGQKIYPAAEALAARGIPFLLLSGYGRDAAPPNHPEWESVSKPFKAADLTKMLSDRVHASQ